MEVLGAESEGEARSLGSQATEDEIQGKRMGISKKMFLLPGPLR